MSLRVARLDVCKATTNSYIAATLARGDPPIRRVLVGQLLGVMQVQIGNAPHVLLNVQWYKQVEEDAQLPGLRRVRVAGPRVFDPPEFIHAQRIDSQMWLTTIPGSARWQHVHTKVKSSHTIPEHLLA